MTFLKKIILYPFLFVIYPALFIISYNKNSIACSLLLEIAILPTATLFFFILLNKTLGDQAKAGISTMLLIILFYYNGFNLPFWLATSLLIVLIILFPICLLKIKQTNKNLHKFTLPLNIMSLLLIIFSIPNIIQTEIGLQNLANKYSTPNHNSKIDVIKENTTYPDIYYIIPDEYTGFLALKKYFNFNNNDFKNFLLNKGFFVAENPSSNYPATIYSVPSSMNFNYLDKIYSEDDKNFIVYAMSYKIIDSKIVNYLKSRGYIYLHILNSWLAFNNSSQSLLQKPDILINCAKQDNIQVTFFYKTILRFFLKSYSINSVRSETECILNGLKKVDNVKGPKFAFIHLTIPHSPYYFKRDGSINFYIGSTSNLEKQKQNYIEQIIYTNTKLKETINMILSNAKRPTVIILQSDHGSRMLNNRSGKAISSEVNYNNIIAIYSSDKSINKYLYNSITPVNIFRIVLNCYFHEKLKLLKDIKYDLSLQSINNI